MPFGNHNLSLIYTVTGASRTQMSRERFPEKKKAIQKWTESHIAKVIQQLKNISFYKVCDKYSLHDSGRGSASPAGTRWG